MKAKFFFQEKGGVHKSGTGYLVNNMVQAKLSETS